MLIRMLIAFQFILCVPLFAVTDQSYSLAEVLENGTLSKKDCDKYFSGQRDRETTLRCGKFMYFYDSLGAPGFPAAIVDLLRKNAPNTVGMALEGFGYYKDPFSSKGLPIGLTEGPKLVGGVASYTPTCGSCHFGQAPDGRFIVGQPDYGLKFSKFELALSVLPELALQPKKLQPLEVQIALEPLKREFFDKSWSRLKVFIQVLRLLPKAFLEKTKPLPDEMKMEFVRAPDGVIDLFAPPGSIDDTVSLPQRILPLWGIDQEGMEKAGSTYGAMLGSHGGTPDMLHIFHSLKNLAHHAGGTKLENAKDDDYFVPISEYVLSLKAPRNQMPFDATRIEVGKSLFERSCSSCHNGPAYAGTRIFDFKDIGTDPNLARMLDPDFTGKALFDAITPEELTRGLRAGRLEGVWSLKRLLHNGSLTSLAQLFCLDGPRPKAIASPGLSTAGHDFTCEGLDRSEKEDLIYFLESI